MTYPLPDVIDYTSRDFASIRDDLIALIPTFAPDWVSRSPNDFGIVLLEQWAYVGDILNYYADRVANEAFLDTATQRSSVIRIAAELGYTPSNPLAASVTLTITNNSGGSSTIPALTQVATTADATTGAQIVFETDVDVTVSDGSSVNVTATEGTTNTDPVYTGTGLADQSFTLFYDDVIQGSISVVVAVGLASDTWTYYPHLLDAGPFDHAYTLSVDDVGVVTVTFGDGANGLIPPNGATVTTTYRAGGGSVGNVATGSLTTFLSDVDGGITVTNNSDATGGADAESTDSIRQNAPGAFQSLNRCVTLKDYSNVAVQVPGVGAASATSAIPTSVNLYIAPSGGGGYTGSGGITGSPTTPFAALLTAVSSAIDVAKPDPTTVVVHGATYIKIDVTVNLHVSANASQVATMNAATAALQTLFDFDNVIFGDTITPNDIYLALQDVNGIDYTDLTALYRDDGASGVGVISLADSEYPVVGNLSITATGGV